LKYIQGKGEFSRKINQHCSAAIESENKRNFPYVVIQGLVHSAEDIPTSIPCVVLARSKQLHKQGQCNQGDDGTAA
jgi:hypothetical protein